MRKLKILCVLLLFFTLSTPFVVSKAPDEPISQPQVLSEEQNQKTEIQNEIQSEPLQEEVVKPVEAAPSPAPEAKSVEPVKQGMSIQIPKIGVNTSVVTVGLENNGELHVPENGHIAGWYGSSAQPGEKGSIPTVITGHMEFGGNVTPGVFYNLHKLAAGDEIFVAKADGSKAVFTVKTSETYPQNNFATQKVYGSVPDAQLRIITCAGSFDKSTGRYTHNLVVYASLSRTEKPVAVAKPSTKFASAAVKPAGITKSATEAPSVESVLPVSAGPPAPVVVSCAVGSFNDQFLCLLNDYRKSMGKKALSFDQVLDNAAADYSETMKAGNFFGHTGLDGSKFNERCANFSTTCYGEILAKGFNSPQKLFDMWKSSPGHNAIMIGDYGQVGLGIAGVYATGLFR